MKTTELFVEQIIIGFLVLATGWLLWTQGELPKIEWDTAIMLVIAAYLTGIIYDRFTDTLFQDLEQLLRLYFGYDKWENNQAEDCFQENLYLINVLDAGSSVAAYSFYLRTRLRLSRAGCTILPAMTTAYLSRNSPEAIRSYLVFIIPSIYIVAFILKLVIPGYYPKTNSKKKDKIGAHYSKYKTRKSSIRKITPWNFIIEPFTWLFLILLVIDLILVSKNWLRMDVITLIGANVLTMLAFWTWFRIMETYKKLLRDYFEFFRHPKKSKTQLNADSFA